VRKREYRIRRKTSLRKKAEKTLRERSKIFRYHKLCKGCTTMKNSTRGKQKGGRKRRHHEISESFTTRTRRPYFASEEKH